MSVEIKEFLAKDAVILDVRTLEEWNEGHIENSKHIVLNTIPTELEQIKAWNKPVIAVCRSGARSGQATQFLNQNGVEAINGGPWGDVAAVLD
ncbi:rhodanese-like domain-containing protein [uncultured Polaribacter sp.]|uniref:rhodanese-like domain-containing protein n=1 Tax=uncultured Polaribacter sp. TaxID=174711 RepID=UPI00261771BB|nr:rhodanese-like domain-containing protein [uncultured Polaribacter sp.]